MPRVLIRFGSEFILSNAKTRCAAAVRAQHGDALGHMTWSWQPLSEAGPHQCNPPDPISLPVPPVVIRTQRPQPERMAAGGGGGGDARRKHSAFTVGGAGRRHSGAPILRRYAAA